MKSRTELGLGLLGLALAACNGDAPTPTDGTTADAEPYDIVGTVAAAMPTVVTVTWRTDADSAGRVEFGEGGAFDRSTPVDAGGQDHSAVLVGLPPGAEISYRVVHGDVVSDVQTVTTGALDPDLPVPTVEGANDQWIAVPLLRDGEARAALVDPQGRIVWSYRDPGALSVFRAVVAHDGSGMIYNSVIQGGGPAEDSALIKVSWDGEQVDRIEVPRLAHDFVELPDGTLVSLAFEERDGLEGNKLVSIADDGTTTDLWSVWDCFDPVTHPGDDPDQGWTHANALDYVPDQDLFLVGMRNLSTIVAVERATGACRWAVGGSGGDVAVSGGSFLHEHQFHLLDDRLLVFDNEGAAGPEARVLEYAFDEGAGTAEVERTIVADPPLPSFILGDVHRLPDGDTLVAWAVPGTIERYAADDARDWHLKLPQGNLLGFFQVLADPYAVP